MKWTGRKVIAVSLIIAGILTLAVTGCASGFFSGTTPPTPAQMAAYNVATNEVTNVEIQVTIQTNNVVVTNTITQVVVTTNQQNLVITQTNVSLQTVNVQQTVPVTNQVVVAIPTYTYTPNATSSATAAAVGTAVNAFAPGIGTAVTAGLMALLAGVGWLFSAKTGSNQSAAANTLAQEVETLLEFVQALPNGASYTTALTAWLQQHQVQTGAASTILTILENEVSNPNAKAAVASVLAGLNTLNPATVTPAQVTAAQTAAAAAKS